MDENQGIESTGGQSAAQKPARVPGKNGGTLTPIRTSEKGAEMARKRWGSLDLGVGIGLAQAAAEFEGEPSVTQARAGMIFGKAIGAGALANAMDRPLDAARTLRALRPPDTQIARTPVVAVQVNISPKTLEYIEGVLDE